MNPTNEMVTTDGGNDTGANQRLVYPAVDVYENDDEFLLVADLPGVDPSSVTVELEASNLHVSGNQNPAWTGGMEPLRFERNFRVPDLVSDDGVAAELRSGVLEIKLRKREAAKPRRIAVTVQ